jgi:hypothetical protein
LLCFLTNEIGGKWALLMLLKRVWDDLVCWSGLLGSMDAAAWTLSENPV